MKPPTRLLALAAATLLLPTHLPAQAQEGNTPPEQPTAPAPSELLPRVSGGVMAGSLIKAPAPEYPLQARLNGTNGRVVLSAIITQEGRVDSLSVISGPEVLRDASLEAVRKWRYKPYLLNGKPTSVQTTITVNFNYTR